MIELTVITLYTERVSEEMLDQLLDDLIEVVEKRDLDVFIKTAVERHDDQEANGLSERV